MDAQATKTVVSLPHGRGVETAPDSVPPAADAPAPDRQRSGRRHARPEAQPAAPRGPFVPLLLGTLSLLGWLGFQTYQLMADREALQAAHQGQQQTVDNAGKLRGSLDALAADTQRMADAGNGNARLLVEELRKRGVTINPAATAATGNATAAAAAPTR